VSFEVNIPKPSGAESLKIETGSSIVIVGANGSGKTRLASYIEDQLGERAHRIAAHRALTLNPLVQKISEKQAKLALRTGWSDIRASINYRKGSRWQDKESVALLNDFDFLLQVLFAEQTNRALITHNGVRSGKMEGAIATKFELLTQVWQSLLPHRTLHVSGDDIQVSTIDSEAKYSASDMSDGERAVFYMMGQALVAEPNTLLIFDEPELHVHKSIMSKIWDELESLRPDCAFIFITHDIDFACSRIAEKYVISKYESTPTWDISLVPDESGFDESTTTLILGSRKPILFVEGGAGSLDIATYRCCYPEWTVIPRGSCEQVIHSVVTFRQNSALTRINCSGIVDADDYSEADITRLNELGVKILPLSEIENIFIHPEVARAILEHEGFSGEELEDKLAAFIDAITSSIDSSKIEQVAIRFCRRRIDRAIKKIDLSQSDSVPNLREKLNYEMSELDIDAIASLARSKIQSSIDQKDLPSLLKIYDNKGLLAIASSVLKNTRRAEFEHWIIRVLNNRQAPKFIEKVKSILPAMK
jgi:ABC-type molybdenum transport system ATPase subunit/photorepair protein PhrA